MKKLALAAAALFTFVVSPARAADMSPPPPILQAPPLPMVELGSNWYLRGDFPYRMFSVPGASGPEDAAALGVGVGYQFSNWLRGDVTLDYQFGSRFGAGDNPDVASLKLWSSALFFNGYVDIGTWYGVTPYVGAGIGAAYNHTDPGAQWNFAYALMAGAAYHLSPNLSVDFGYRFADLGKGISLSNAPIEVYSHEFRVGFRYKLD